MAQIGCHVSISGGIGNAPGYAAERACAAFQVFTRNPRGWAAKDLDDATVGAYKTALESSGISAKHTCAHMPYLPNLSSTKPDGHAKSVASLVDEVRRCGRLGIPYLVTHLGSHLGAGAEAGIKRLVSAYKRAATVKNGVTILLENTAGQKNSVGSDFVQLGEILGQLEPAGRFGVCIDTCHAFAYGYDLRTEKGVRDAFGILDESAGGNALKILHLNDAKAGLGSNLDRHHHIGLGEIGKAGMRAAVRLAAKRHVPIILETPIDSVRDDYENVRVAKSLE
ncbi:MAG: deoxyribonuclease IV [Thaumarchaeota archaeon]|nr:deoxyribonuclease IV [Nitrososphaerota archaeon]RNJ72546.1 MAG: deoxyribonuclease IV [Thaumarchaeota archaeon S14]RNJ74211.1 MAG: deoxyribonuclease IV [Thaumarchaeota archaeon S13]RNJ76406.1 MAG: deoxyribonuclease IV [Thaumarchaeota archaeon S15]MDD9809385.1 deoxyribonuclease IV [Nitrososphaerota archaeon]